MTETQELKFEAVHRHCGGWLVYSSRKNPLQIGVVGQTEAEATQRYQAAVAEWRHNIDESPSGRRAQVA